jgi:hypothetical protein
VTDVRERYEAWVRATYATHPHAWDRLCELQAELLAKLPDNDHVQRGAWLVGITEDGGPFVSGWFALYARLHAEETAAKAKEAARKARKLQMEQGLLVSVTRHYDEPGEPGRPTEAADVTVTSRETGESLRFAVRNIFDFGTVVNPAYGLTSGARPGGLAGDASGAWYWMDFRGDEGWVRVRDATPLEAIALEYLLTYPPVFDGIRM